MFRALLIFCDEPRWWRKESLLNHDHQAWLTNAQGLVIQKFAFKLPRKARGRKWSMRFVQFFWDWVTQPKTMSYGEIHGISTCIPIQTTCVLFSSDFLAVPASHVWVLVPAVVLMRQCMQHGLLDYWTVTIQEMGTTFFKQHPLGRSFRVAKMVTYWDVYKCPLSRL